MSSKSEAITAEFVKTCLEGALIEAKNYMDTGMVDYDKCKIQVFIEVCANGDFYMAQWLFTQGHFPNAALEEAFLSTSHHTHMMKWL